MFTTFHERAALLTNVWRTELINYGLQSQHEVSAASDACIVTSVTPSHRSAVSALSAKQSLEKNFTSPSFLPGCEVHLTTPSPDNRKDPQAEYDRLMHNRKGLSGSEFAGIGLQFAVTIVVFTFAGIWLDKRLGTSPWLLITLALGGSGLGFWSMYRRMMPRNEK